MMLSFSVNYVALCWYFKCVSGIYIPQDLHEKRGRNDKEMRLNDYVVENIRKLHDRGL